MEYILYSQSKEEKIYSSQKFEGTIILQKIIEHLTEYPEDMVEYLINGDIVSLYEVNPKNNVISKCVGPKLEQYRSIV